MNCKTQTTGKLLVQKLFIYMYVLIILAVPSCIKEYQLNVTCNYVYNY